MKTIKNNDEIMNNYENMMTCDETNKKQWKNNEQLYMYNYVYIYMKTMLKYDENLFRTFTK